MLVGLFDGRDVQVERNQPQCLARVNGRSRLVVVNRVRREVECKEITVVYIVR